MRAAAGLFLAACETTIAPDGVLVGAELEKRLTHTQLTMKPVN